MLKALAAITALAVAAAGAVYYLDQNGDDAPAKRGDSPPVSQAGIIPSPGPEPVGEPAPGTPATGTACERLSGLAANIAAKTTLGVAFVKELARDAAGIRPGRRGIYDLARGGTNRIPGRGFSAEFDDGSEGQARHFAGVAYATTLGGANPTRWISEHLRRDAADSPDGLLSDEAIDFTEMLTRGDLATDEAADWILTHLCE